MQWFEKCYARLLIDNHISEDDPSFMTGFDPEVYAAMAKRAGIQSAMVYATCHNGNCYYPTKIGHMHANIGERDIFGETIAALKASNIVPVAYYTTIFHNNSAKKHPSWRMEDFSDQQHDKRYWWSCPNNPEYREFTKNQISEVIAYDVAGIFIDMTFWPIVCACHNCRERYLKESNREIPSIVDWGNEDWVCFQRSREKWMAEFTEVLTSHIKSIKPHVSVTHQFSPVLAGWSFGQSPAIAAACDFAGGDFYGGKYQQSLGVKVLSAFSKNAPFEFMTSRCVNLYDHTSVKSADELFCSVATTLANGGAYFFIDAINPDGTLEQDVYDRLGCVSEQAKPFMQRIQAHRPKLTASVGLYFSMMSHMDSRDNGLNLKSGAAAASNMTPSTAIPSLKETLGTAVALSTHHIPYWIITSENSDFDGIQTLIINDATFLSNKEVNRLREFVYNGGTLIATGRTSLYDVSGHTSGNFQLSDVFGVSYSGNQTGRISYLAYNGEIDTPPTEAASSGRTQYLLSNSPAPLVKATTARVLADVCATLFNPDDTEHYASIHSNPPGQITPYHGLTVNSFGKGKCVYLYSSVFGAKDETHASPDFLHAHQTFGGRLLKHYSNSASILSTNAPASVEITLLKSSVDNTYILCLVNYQKDLPNIPVHDIYVKLRLPDAGAPKKCTRISDNDKIEFEFADGIVELMLHKLDTIEMFQIEL